MDSSLHMHVASLKVQDDIRRGAAARRAAQAAKTSAKASRPRHQRWVAARRALRNLGEGRRVPAGHSGA
jgi:hypothetical protein